jgi:tetratricopeptide (TPR) repeat protein/TolB-like protein
MNKRPPRFRKASPLLVVGVFFFFAARLIAQQPAPHAPHPSGQAPNSSLEPLYLVFPFENAGAPPRLDWIGEGLEELTIERFSHAGLPVYSHSGRVTEMDRYGLPDTAKLSRASMLHVAQEMNADNVVYGSFASDGKTLTVTVRLMRINPPALLPAVVDRGPLDSLMDLHTRIIWRLLSVTDRSYPLSLAEFSKLQRPLSLAAFEQYIRGLLANDDDVRLRDLKEAAKLEPEWPDPAFAIGEVYFGRNDCNAALPWFARVPATNARSVEAIFSIGVCRLRLGQPEKAEEVFASLQDGLRRSLSNDGDLPELLNNLGLALAQQGKLAAAQTALGRARDLDPDEDDYPFNLGLLSLRQNELPTAATHFREAVHREPDNPEDLAFLIYTLQKAGKGTEVEQVRSSAVGAYGEKGLPAIKIDAKGENLLKYERVMKELDTTTLRLEMGNPTVHPSVSADGTPAKATPAAHLRTGRQELAAGHLAAAEQEFQAAIAADPQNASAHRELADIDRRQGKLDDAVKELQLSLALRDSAVARTVLARIYLEQKKPELARIEVEKAVKLAPNYTEAKELLEHLGKNNPTGGAK